MKIRKIAAPPIDPKFEPGQRVRVSTRGMHEGIAPAGTRGTVLACGWVVAVQIDGAEAHAYHPDFWEDSNELVLS